ncbi:unnamed protein product [Callosobruchus maculatus]|uniref:Uncharacterized protein n=1 Tax=Callosobruchus maculatus TaxID=64391 RepID=A0A653DN97_CALMS|nr:unnamed protein product [Callosobruchus maculatus]
MDLDSESTATSIDESTENLCDNPTRDTLAEGLMGLIKPTVDLLDEKVKATRCTLYEGCSSAVNHQTILKRYSSIECQL